MARIKMNRGGNNELMTGAAAEALVAQHAAAVVDACNSQSSWGGYFHDSDSDGVRARQRIWSIAAPDNDDSSARVRRMVNNLGAGA